MSSIADMLNGLSDIISGKDPNRPTAVVPRVPSQMVGAPGKFTVPMANADWITGIADFAAGVPKAVATTVEDAWNNPSEWHKQLGTVIPRAVSGVAGALPGLYHLADEGLQWATDDRMSLPGGEAAKNLYDDIMQPSRDWTERITGKPQNDSLLTGTPSELAASWLSLGLGGVVKAPAAITSRVDEAVRALEAGKGAAARTGEYAIKGLEMITPVMVRTPTPAVVAGSVAIPGAIGAGLEMAFPLPDKQKLDEEAKAATDTAVAGAESAAAAVQPVQAGFSGTGNPWLDTAIIGVGVAGGIAAMKRDVLARITRKMTGSIGDNGLGDASALRTQVVDRTAAIKDSFSRVQEELGFPRGADLPERFANKIDASHGAAIDTKLRSIYQYGEIPDSKVVLPSINDMYKKTALIDSPRAIQQIDDALNVPRVRWSSIVRNDPQMNEVAVMYDSAAKRMLDYALEQRYISPAAHARLNKQSPHEILTTLSKGDAYVKGVARAGGPLPGNALQDLPTYIEETVRRVEWNKNKALWTQFMRNAADNGNAYAASLLGKRDGKVGMHNRDRFITYRDRNGNARTQEILDPNILRALKTGNDISRLHALSGSMAKFARLFEQSATGVIATAMLQPFAHIAALYNAGLGSAVRQRGVAVGHFDKALQGMGFKFGLPGDPTIIPDAVFRAMQGISAVSAKRIADTLHSSVVSNGVISNALTPNSAEKVAAALTNYYKRSWVHAFQQQGLLGPAAFEGVNPNNAIKYVQARMRSANVPVNVARDTYRFVNDILHTISSSPTASVYALNKNLHPDLRARAVREFTGDPSRSGAFHGRGGEALGKLTTATPWGNIFLQSTDRFLRALKNDPKSVIAGLTTTVGLPTISVALWNASQGSDSNGNNYSDYQYNRRNPDRQASSIYVALPGVAAESGLEIPVDPLSRPYKLGVELLAGYHLGLLDGSLFAPENEGMRIAFTEMVRNRWLGFGEGSVAKSALEQSLIPPVPTAAGALGAVFGKNVRSYIDVGDVHSRKDAGFTSSDARNPERSLLGMHESAVAENLVRSLGANAGAMAYNLFMDSVNRADAGEPIARNAWQQLKLGLSDSGRQVSGALFGSFASVSPSQESSAKLVSEKVKGLQSLTQAFQAVTQQGALTGGEIVGTRQRGYQALLGGRLAIEPTDPRMLVLSQYAQQYSRQVNHLMGMNKDAYSQRNSIQISTKYSPERKRSMMNMLGDEIVARDRQLLTLLQQFEGAVSAQLGSQIRLDKLNINQGLDQFEKMQ